MVRESSQRVGFGIWNARLGVVRGADGGALAGELCRHAYLGSAVGESGSSVAARRRISAAGEQ